MALIPRRAASRASTSGCSAPSRNENALCACSSTNPLMSAPPASRGGGGGAGPGRFAPPAPAARVAPGIAALGRTPGVYDRKRTCVCGRTGSAHPPPAPPPPPRLAGSRCWSRSSTAPEQLPVRASNPSVVDAVEEPGVVEEVVGEAKDSAVGGGDAPFFAGPA